MLSNSFVEGAGGCVVSNNVLSGAGRLKWLVREEPVDPADSGWRFFSDIDDAEYLDDPAHLSVVSFDHVAGIEPAVIGVYLLPFGTDLTLEVEGGAKRFVDAHTGNVLEL